METSPDALREGLSNESAAWRAAREISYGSVRAPKPFLIYAVCSKRKPDGWNGVESLRTPIRFDKSPPTISGSGRDRAIQRTY